jgi:hypothetical protein
MLEYVVDQLDMETNALRFGADSRDIASFDDARELWRPEKRLSKLWASAPAVVTSILPLTGHGFFRLDQHQPLPLPEDANLYFGPGDGQMMIASAIEVGWKMTLADKVWSCSNGDTGKKLYVCDESFTELAFLDQIVTSFQLGPRLRLSALAV